jgi:hypothetical protein
VAFETLSFLICEESDIMKINQNKLGRNDICHCGSGNKYKRCCLSSDITTPRFRQNNITLLKGAERLRSRVKQNLGNKCTIFQQSEVGGIKMSEVIIDLADFLLDRAKTRSQQEVAIGVTCLAWNIAVVGAEKGQIFLDDYLGKMNDPVHQQDTLDIIGIIIEEKQTYYADINRVILDHELLGNVNNLHLNIVSTVIEDY